MPLEKWDPCGRVGTCLQVSERSHGVRLVSRPQYTFAVRRLCIAGEGKALAFSWYLSIIWDVLLAAVNSSENLVSFLWEGDNYRVMTAISRVSGISFYQLWGQRAGEPAAGGAWGMSNPEPKPNSPDCYLSTRCFLWQRVKRQKAVSDRQQTGQCYQSWRGRDGQEDRKVTCRGETRRGPFSGGELGVWSGFNGLEWIPS